MKRRQALGAMLGGAAGLIAQQQPRRPNLVFILVDDLRFDAVSYLGHAFVKTPNIDRIAREGAIFRNMFVTTPLCSPSRASFLTGRYVRSHGVNDNGDHAELSHRLLTFPRLLHDAGYETGYFGKWHMGTDDSPRPGIDRWVSFRGQGQYDDPPLNVDGQRIPREGYITDLLTDYAVEFIRKQRSKPFCVYIAHKAVHGPFTPAARHAHLFSNAVIQRSPNAKDSLEGKPVLTRALPEVAAKKKAAKKKAGEGQAGPNDDLIRNQMRCLTAIDEGVGRILQALEQTRALDNTVVIFTSDNGYFWGEHGLGDKRAAYEESIRIPMAARYPKMIKAGRNINELSLNIDIAPTMLDLAGVAIPKSVQGRSLVPVLQGKAKSWRKDFLCEYYMEAQNPRIPTWEAVRTERWKYVHYIDVKDMDEMYDLQSDAGELKNLIRDGASQPMLDSLRKNLDRYRKEITA